MSFKPGYIELIEKKLQFHLGTQFRYEKNSKNMYALLAQYGDQKKAIHSAKKLMERFKGRENFASHNPCTTVWKLVEELLQLI